MWLYLGKATKRGRFELNTKIESYKRLYKDTTVKQNTWVMLSIPHGLGTIPNFMIATPQSLSAGRIYWITRADETNITISIYSSDPENMPLNFTCYAHKNHILMLAKNVMIRNYSNCTIFQIIPPAVVLANPAYMIELDEI